MKTVLTENSKRIKSNIERQWFLNLLSMHVDPIGTIPSLHCYKINYCKGITQNFAITNHKWLNVSISSIQILFPRQNKRKNSKA